MSDFEFKNRTSVTVCHDDESLRFHSNNHRNCYLFARNTCFILDRFLDPNNYSPRYVVTNGTEIIVIGEDRIVGDA